MSAKAIPMFDFEAAMIESQKDLESDRLFCLLLGASGSGKSRTIGTLDVPTLYLYFSGEQHGPKSAQQAGGKNIKAICLDFANKILLTPDQTYERLLAVLAAEDDIKKAGFQAIVLDGITELETMVRGTKRWELGCATKDGKHDSFAETKICLKLMRPVFDQLRALRSKLNQHIVTTGILDIKNHGEYGSVGESSPRSASYGMTEGVIQQFGDVLVVGPLEDDNGNKAWRFQMGAEVIKVSQDKNKIVKRAINYSPRIELGPNGRNVTIPKYIEADLKAIHAIKVASK